MGNQLLQGVQVLRVEPKKSRDGSKDMWDVGFSDGVERRTFRGDVAALAASVVGQPGHTFEVSQNGKYNNLEGVILAGQALPQQPVAPGTQIAAGQPAAQGVQTQAPTATVGGDFESARDINIRRQVAFKGAHELVSNLLQGAGPEAVDQAVELIASLTDRFENGLKAGQAVAAPAPAPSTPAEVAEVVNAEAGQEVVAQGAANIKW